VIDLNSCECKICGESFLDKKSFHKHLKSSHKKTIGDYYTEYFPKKCLYSGKVLGFSSNLDKYSSTDFYSKEYRDAWANLNTEETKNYLLNKVRDRVRLKNLKFAPSAVEIDTLPIPSFKSFETNFGSYDKACLSVGLEPLLKRVENLEKIDISKLKICVDTREQLPLNFKNSHKMALAFGDYTLMGEDYSYTYVDRKNDSDFRGTFGKDIDRFRRELVKCSSLDCFMYVVVEDSIEEIKKKNSRQKWGSDNCEFIFKNMRSLMHEFPRKIQFIFAGSRDKSEKIIPFLLAYGKDLWDKDVYAHLKLKKFI